MEHMSNYSYVYNILIYNILCYYENQIGLIRQADPLQDVHGSGAGISIGLRFGLARGSGFAHQVDLSAGAGGQVLHHGHPALVAGRGEEDQLLLFRGLIERFDDQLRLPVGAVIRVGGVQLPVGDEACFSQKGRDR